MRKGEAGVVGAAAATAVVLGLWVACWVARQWSEAAGAARIAAFVLLAVVSDVSAVRRLPPSRGHQARLPPSHRCQIEWNWPDSFCMRFVEAMARLLSAGRARGGAL